MWGSVTACARNRFTSGRVTRVSSFFAATRILSISVSLARGAEVVGAAAAALGARGGGAATGSPAPPQARVERPSARSDRDRARFMTFAEDAPVPEKNLRRSVIRGATGPQSPCDPPPRGLDRLFGGGR